VLPKNLPSSCFRYMKLHTGMLLRFSHKQMSKNSDKLSTHIMAAVTLRPNTASVKECSYHPRIGGLLGGISLYFLLYYNNTYPFIKH
jgi:hypothetical protein